jgi:hypothetical protein
MKRDLNDKDKIIEEKNLELSRLRTEITDVNSRIKQSQLTIRELKL